MINETMRLNVKMINSYTFPIDIHRKGSIGLLKQKISEKISMAPSKQRLIFQGKVLLNDKLLLEYHLEENDVIHLIEQTQQQNNQHQQTNNNQQESRVDQTFNDLLSSLFIRNPLMNLNNNESNINSNSNSSDIPESFHHLLKQSNFIQTESMETIIQGINSLYSIINRSKYFPISEAPSIKHLYSNTDEEEEECNNYKIGQWVDIKDSSDQWIEGQIANKRSHEVNVHYLGLTNQLNHWMDSHSNRIALFRSFTGQNLNNQFASPFPNKTNSDNSLSIELQNKYDPLTNDLITFFDLIKEKVSRLMKQRDAMKNNSSYRSKDDLLNNERFYYLQIMQLYPLMDRLGRLLIDVSGYLMNMSFKFFEDNIYLFKSNIQDERLSFLDYNARNADSIRKEEVKEFIKLTEYSVIKMKKTEVEARRPVLGLLVNVHRNERRENSFDSNLLLIGNESSFCFSSLKKKNPVDKGIQTIINYSFTVVLNDYFSIDRKVIESIKSANKVFNGNANSTSIKMNKMRPNEKVVLVSRDKPVSESLSSTLAKSKQLSKKKRVNEIADAPKKKYRLSQSKATSNNNS